MYAHEWMRDMPKEAWKARHTYSLWAFPQADYPKLLGEYFAFCKSYYKEHRYRGNVVSGASRAASGSRFAVQRQLLRSDVHAWSRRPAANRAGTIS